MKYKTKSKNILRSRYYLCGLIGHLLLFLARYSVLEISKHHRIFMNNPAASERDIEMLRVSDTLRFRFARSIVPF
jgi:hypothetical protein